MSRIVLRRPVITTVAALALLLASVAPASAAASTGVIVDPWGDESPPPFDILSAELETTWGPRLVATMVVDGAVPPPG
ncbi:MAG TPA: hypothetical protein VF230_02525, partial [Acidimicrobiales bacterium]